MNWLWATVLLAIVGGCDRPSETPLATQESLTHLRAFAADDRMPLDVAVLVEFSEDTSLLAPVSSDPSIVLDSAAEFRRRVQVRMGGAGYPAVAEHTRQMVGALRGGEPAVVDGDHQQMVVRDGSLRYGAELFLVASRSGVRLNEVAFGSDALHWLASVVNRSDEAYADLGIPGLKGSACIIAGRAPSGSDFVAYAVPVTAAGACSQLGVKKTSDATSTWVRLDVQRLRPADVDASLDEGTLPKSARFEWADPEQQIGVKCGGHWCAIRKAGSSKSEPTPPDGTSDDELKKVRRLKGWHDLQMLAAQDSDGRLVPSGVLARIRPIQRGFMQAINTDLGTPRSVAEITILPLAVGAVIPEKYRKIGLTAEGTYRLKLCRGDSAKCNPGAAWPTTCHGTDQIWGQLYDLTDTALRDPFPVCYHQTASGEWATRWQWRSDDEVMWVRCLNGCCSPQF